jgi:hypothetical protein
MVIRNGRFVTRQRMALRSAMVSSPRHDDRFLDPVRGRAGAGQSQMGRGWASSEGLPFPLGVSWVEDEGACNFALYSKHAETVTLLLYREGDQERPCVRHELRYLTNKSGRVWHCRLAAPELRGAVYYG